MDETIQVAIDTTDHICFHCICGEVMQIEDVKTTNFGKTKCTRIHLRCEKCNMAGQKKFYWNADASKFCLSKTTIKK